MEDFKSLGLPQDLLHSLTNMKFLTPTPIQSKTIPPALLGSDILGSAQTGTGKTAAYAIPLISHLINNPDASALVLTPTRELAVQVLSTLHQMTGRKMGIYTALLIGGDPMFKQLKQLRFNPRIIVGTPGRINDHLMRGTLSLDSTSFFVLDETDRMLDMGFSVQLQKIAQHLPEKRQTLMFSATMAPSIVKIAQTYLKNEVRVAVGSTTTPTEKITQEIVRITEPNKYDALVEQLNRYAGSCIIFVKTKLGTEKLALRLRGSDHDATAIHGDLRQRNRERVISAFRNGKNRILVATDIAARGLDIPDIECVINYDLPQCPEDYIHRIGRTGRAGAEGRAISFITSQDNLKWKNICRLMNPSEHGGAYDPNAEREAYQSNNRRRSGGHGGGNFRRSNGGGGYGRGNSRGGGYGRSNSSEGSSEHSPRRSFSRDNDNRRSFGRDNDDSNNRGGFGRSNGGEGNSEHSPRRSFGRDNDNGSRGNFGRSNTGTGEGSRENSNRRHSGTGTGNSYGRTGGNNHGRSNRDGNQGENRSSQFNRHRKPQRNNKEQDSAWF